MSINIFLLSSRVEDKQQDSTVDTNLHSIMSIVHNYFFYQSVRYVNDMSINIFLLSSRVEDNQKDSTVDTNLQYTVLCLLYSVYD